MLDILTLAKALNASQLSVYEIIVGAVLIVAALLIIFVVLLQEGRQANVGVISGAADSFMDKGAAKSLDQKLAKWTKVIAIVFFLLVLGGMMVSKFLTNKALNEKNPPAPVPAPSSSVSVSNTASTTGSTVASSAAESTTATTTAASK